MTTPPVLLDTDTLSVIMRQHPLAVVRATAYLAVHKKFTFSIMTRFEVLRGLNAKNATTQLVTFERLCANSLILPLTDEIIVKAASIYAELHRQGTLIGDADILIAATALVYNLTVVTNNENHFRRISQLSVENWLKP